MNGSHQQRCNNSVAGSLRKGRGLALSLSLSLSRRRSEFPRPMVHAWRGSSAPVIPVLEESVRGTALVISEHH